MEIRYKNTVEGSVQCLADAVCSTERYKRSIARKSWILFFVLLVGSMALLNQVLFLRESGRTNVLLDVLLGICAILTVLSVTYFRAYSRKRGRAKMIRLMSAAKESFNRELLLRVENGALTMGTEERSRSYPVGDVADVFPHDQHLCITLKSGAALAIPDRYFADDGQRDELIALLTPQKKSEEE